MTFIQFLIDTPVMAFLLLLALLVTVVPVVAALFSRKKPGHTDRASVPAKKPPTTRFLGTQMDLAILIFGALLLIGAIGWVRKTFFEERVVKIRTPPTTHRPLAPHQIRQ